MKNFNRYILTLVAIVLFFNACSYKRGSGNIVRETRAVNNFDGIKVSEGIEAELKNGPFSVIVEADDNLIEYLRTDVKGGVLKVHRSVQNVDDAHLKVFITAPDIRKVQVSSGAEIEIVDVLKNAEEIEFDASSAGTIEGSVDAPKIHIEASSGSDVLLKGRTRYVEAKSSSGSSIKAFDLLSENVEAQSSSGSSIKVFASVSLKGEASSGSKILYRGGGSASAKQSSGGVVKAE